MLKKLLFVIWLLLCSASIDAKLPQIDPPKVIEKVHEIMKAHAGHKELTPELIKRIFANYLEELDPNKTYFIQSDILPFVEPNEALIDQTLKEYNKADFHVFSEIHEKMVHAINRRNKIEKKIDLKNLPKNVKSIEFKDMKWAKTEDELLARLERIRALQIETFSKLKEEFLEKSFQRIEKNQKKFEEKILDASTPSRSEFMLSNVLKATASALDAHTSYFTPDEAEQFMINVQQRLFGIGAQLRDDLNGFSVMKVIEGGPAALGKELKAKDRIVAVDGEPVIGMDIIDAVELIRGKENTPVILTIIREEGEGKDQKQEKLDIKVIRGEVVINEARYESSYEPYGDGAIGYLRLHSFYQDPEHSSAIDLAKEITKLKKEHPLKGLILDLRYNTGGMLSQAVEVTGLFIKKGVVVGIKDNTGSVQYLRNLEDKVSWDGPLIVLTNKASASASEIVAQTLQDYGRALIVGDETTYGKGSFQTFTLNFSKEGLVNPQGEYKVTRGRYYTVSGKTPQLTGVLADVVLPGPLSSMDLGEKFAKYPLENDSIKPNFNDDLSDIPEYQRAKIKALYKFDLQQKLDLYTPYLTTLKKNTAYRIEKNKNYQTFLKELKKDNAIETETEEQFGQNDLQLTEAYSIMKDLIILLQEKKPA